LLLPCVPAVSPNVPHSNNIQEPQASGIVSKYEALFSGQWALPSTWTTFFFYLLGHIPNIALSPGVRGVRICITPVLFFGYSILSVSDLSHPV
jgi:hypothetical protein